MFHSISKLLKVKTPSTPHNLSWDFPLSFLQTQATKKGCSVPAYTTTHIAKVKQKRGTCT